MTIMLTDSRCKLLGGAATSVPVRPVCSCIFS